MMEKECSGMYFSGHLLDSYSEHLASLTITPLADLLAAYADDAPPEAAVQFPDRKLIYVAGIITACTRKTTKKGETMLFFTLEDRLREIEVLAFPRQYNAYAELLHTDSAVFLRASVSVRPEETPKLLLNEAAELLENDRYRAEASCPAAANSIDAAACVEQAPPPLSAGARLYLDAI